MEYTDKRLQIAVDLCDGLITEPKMWLGRITTFMYDIYPKLGEIIDVLAVLFGREVNYPLSQNFIEVYKEFLKLAESNLYLKLLDEPRVRQVKILKEVYPHLIRLKAAFETPQGYDYLAWFYLNRIGSLDDAVKYLEKSVSMKDDIDAKDTLAKLKALRDQESQFLYKYLSTKLGEKYGE